ncbi:MarR family winged helix-turn-helix transcriptional regulator [Candidatus Protofrankia californiensis]|uniref:MarR family winged helix-turn-helix transcriptional regulator n=1 Tax=Candidatus Protofrankia californiensis TaxID=1839754 RepID=UPI0010418721|nr:MarR family winged helix-turn-helix transcriptional regulator [Candidatus Protofrankia californiensis]
MGDMPAVNADRGVAPSLREQVFYAFARFGPAWVRYLHASVGLGGLSPAGVRLLSALRHHPHPPIMRDLVQDLGTTARAVTGLVDTLEHEGLVRRTRHPRDRRAILITLTSKGEQVVDRVGQEHVERASALFDVLSEQDQADLVRILGLLGDELAARGQSVQPRGFGCSPAGTESN